MPPMKSTLLADRGMLVLPAEVVGPRSEGARLGPTEQPPWLSEEEVSRWAPWLRAYSRRRLSLPVRVYERCKRVLDLAVAILLLPFVVPLVGAGALAIWIASPGRSLFCWHPRMGRGGLPFRALALRTSAPAPVGAKRRGGELALGAAGGVTWAGRLVRRLGLEHLPQLYNVLRGDMSIVGPPPAAPAADAGEPWQRCRLAVKPGFTGVSQISLRGNAPLERRLPLDLAYVHYRCPALDIAILLRAVPAVLLGRRRASS